MQHSTPTEKKPVKKTKTRVSPSAIQTLPDGTRVRKCSRCHITKTLDEHYRYVKSKNYYTGYCRDCERNLQIERNAKKPDGCASKYHVFSTYGYNAKKRGVRFSLTKKRFYELIESPCYYCGAERTNHRVVPGDPVGYYHNGIDRLDNDGGYTPENCVPSCKACNGMKMTLDGESFLDAITKIARHLGL